MLPLPPTANSYWNTRVVKQKGTGRMMGIPYTTDAAKDYKSDIEERMTDLHCRFYSKKPLEMTVVVCPADARRQDISNRLKTFEDALKDAKVFEDDSQMVAIHLYLGPKIKQGRVMLFLSEVLIDSDRILSHGLSVKYIASHYAAPVLPEPAPQQSGELFQDEVSDEVGVRRPSRRQLAGRRARRLHGAPQEPEQG